MVLEVPETVTHALHQFQESILKCDCRPCRRNPNMPSKMKNNGVNRDVRKSAQTSTNSDELQDVREKKKSLLRHTWHLDAMPQTQLLSTPVPWGCH